MTRKPTLADAILSLVPNAQFSTEEFSDTNYNINWFQPTNPTVTKDQIETERSRLISIWESLEYQRKRVEAYPPIGEQLDIIYHQGLDAWKEQIDAIKEAFPKP
jgi:hypothetical protein